DIVVKPGSGITTLADLKGKTLGVLATGSGSEFYANAALAHAGVSKDDVEQEVVGYGSPGLTALNKGSIDALVNYNTDLARMRAKGNELKALPKPDEIGTNYSFGFIANTDFVDGRSAEMEALGSIFSRGLKFAEEHP